MRLFQLLFVVSKLLIFLLLDCCQFFHPCIEQPAFFIEFPPPSLLSLFEPWIGCSPCRIASDGFRFIFKRLMMASCSTLDITRNSSRNCFNAIGSHGSVTVRSRLREIATQSVSYSATKLIAGRPFGAKHRDCTCASPPASPARERARKRAAQPFPAGGPPP